MAKTKVGILFSREFEGTNPLGHINTKLPTYIRLLELCVAKGWEVYVLTRKTYQGQGIFKGAWLFDEGKFKQIFDEIKIDLAYDRSAGVAFPQKGDESVVWVNRLDFKVLCWDKWAAYKKIGEYMPKTFWIESHKDLKNILPQIKTDWVVLKPFNGLKGFGIFIGPKDEALNFKFDPKYKNYIAQEFVDTSGGLNGITKSLHDLRIVVINGKVVWSHVRVPPKGDFKANAAIGGILTEVDYEEIPETVKRIVEKISNIFYEEYDNPVYSLDFGLQNGKPYIFEINDQIGFPKWEMKNRDTFLNALVANFKSKLNKS